MEQGVPQKTISEELKVTPKTIYRPKKRAENLPKGVTPSRKKGSGRPRKTSSRTNNFLRREMMMDPELSAVDLKINHPELLQDVSVRTIQHRLHKDMGLPFRKPVKKPLLTKLMKKKRLQFCRKYKDWSAERWRGVMLSDESIFCLFDSNAMR